MAKISYVQNGVKKSRPKSRKRNGVAKRTATKTASNGVAKRRSVSVATAKSVLKRNGLKAVSLKAVANGKKRKKRRRNGVSGSAKTYVSRARNGILGNTKQDAKTVGAVLGGAAVTKIVGRMIIPFVAPYMAKVGVGQFTELVVDGAIALAVVPMAARKIAGNNAATSARIGGLLVVALDAIEQIAPDLLSYNPFNSSPVVLANGAPALTPAAVAKLVETTSATPNEKAAVAGAMRQLSADSSFYPTAPSGGQVMSQMPLMNE